MGSIATQLPNLYKQVIVVQSGVLYPKSLTFPPPLGTPTQVMGDPGHRPARVPHCLRNWRINDMLQERLGRGDFVVLRPGVGDTKPFYLAKIVGQRETLPSGLAAVRLEYYTPYVDDRLDDNDIDPYTCHYEPCRPDHYHIPASKLPLVTIYYSLIVDRVVMRRVYGSHGLRYRIGCPRAVRLLARRW